MTPQFPCGSDVTLLPLLCPTSEKNHKRFAVSAKIDTVAWAEVDDSLLNPSADCLGIGPIDEFELRNSPAHFQSRWRIEAAEPSSKWTRAVVVNVFKNSHSIVT